MLVRTIAKNLNLVVYNIDNNKKTAYLKDKGSLDFYVKEDEEGLLFEGERSKYSIPLNYILDIGWKRLNNSLQVNLESADIQISDHGSIETEFELKALRHYLLPYLKKNHLVEYT